MQKYLPFITWNTPETRPMGYQRMAIELLCSSVVAKSEENTVSGIVRQLNINNFTAACNGGSIRTYYVIAATHKNRCFRAVAVCNIS